MRRGVIYVSMLLGLCGCSVIDEDLSDCGDQVKVDYELQLVTNMTTELTTQLDTQTDVNIAQGLRDYLDDIFTDFAHDVDLSFYDTEGDSLRLQHDEHIMNANQASYSLNLPMRQYMHLAAANILNNQQVAIEGDMWCHRSVIRQVYADTINSHTTGIFTARQPMEVLGNVDQQFDVHLYMANCAVALVVDPQGHPIDGMRVFMRGFATGFSICDSVYHYSSYSPLIRADYIEPEQGGGEVAFCSVSFPSRKPTTTRSRIEAPELFPSEPGEQGLWEVLIYVPQPDGTITETKFDVKEPLSPGQMKIIKARVTADGSVITEAPEVGVSVTLDWKQGNTYQPEI